jgi:hypothetical protein
MTDVPKIAYHRLRAATPERDRLERAHPEADVLTAFSEQALSATERDGVLQHLAVCTDCRDVVVLALPAMDLTVAPAEAGSEEGRTSVPDKARTNWLAWANIHWGRLSWAALAAGIAVAVLVVGPGMQHLTKPNPPIRSVANQTAAPDGPPALGTQAVSGSLAAREPGAKPEAADVTRQLSADKSKGMKAVPAPSGTVAIEAAKKKNEKVEASGAPTTLASNEGSADSRLMGIEEAPIRRSKPALGAEVNESAKTAGIGGSSAQAIAPLNGRNVNTLAANGAAANLKQSASWTIARGVLQRSLDGGQSWQTAVRAEHPLLCFANRGQQIWAGGPAGTLLHSTDGGTTWTTVSASFKDQPLSSDITHIEMRGLAGIVLTTENHESWNSTDGGMTWEKVRILDDKKNVPSD